MDFKSLCVLLIEARMTPLLSERLGLDSVLRWGGNGVMKTEGKWMNFHRVVEDRITAGSGEHST